MLSPGDCACQQLQLRQAAQQWPEMAERAQP